MTAARKTTRGKARTAGRTRPARVTSSRAKKRTTKRVTSTAKRAVKKKAAARKATAKSATKRSARATTTRKVARKPRPAVVPFVPTAFSAQRAGAATRDLMLFELVRARAAVKAALQGIASGRALHPIAPGKWSLLEIVLHLSERDRVRLEEFDLLHAGVAPSWRGLNVDQIAAVNEAHLAPLRGHSWDEALRRMDSLRDELMERLARVPADEHVWRKGHAFADTMGHLSQHDRHHAQQIKQARIGG